MKTLQKFSAEYLKECKKLKNEEVVQFLEDFRVLHGGGDKGKSRLISLRAPENILACCKKKARLNKVPYQTQLKQLMLDWLEG